MNLTDLIDEVLDEVFFGHLDKVANIPEPEFWGDEDEPDSDFLPSWAK